MVNKAEIEYFFNSIYFGMFVSVCRMYGHISKIVDKIIFAVIPVLLPKKAGERYLQNYKMNLPDYNRLVFNPSEGICNSVATYNFGWITTSFFSPISLTIAVILYFTGLEEKINPIFNLIIILLPIFIGYIPISRLVFKNNKNIKYVKKFLKKDTAWQSYWIKASMLYSLVGLLFLIFGIWLAVKIGIWYVLAK